MAENNNQDSKVQVDTNKSASVSSQQGKEVVSFDDVHKIFDDRIKPEKEEFLKSAYEQLQRELQAAQASYISVFGIFASITSFLVIEFQFLKTIEHVNQLVGFTLVLASLLFGFNIGLDYLIQSRLNQRTTASSWLFSLMVLIMLAVGIFLVVCKR